MVKDAIINVSLRPPAHYDPRTRGFSANAPAEL